MGWSRPVVRLRRIIMIMVVIYMIQVCCGGPGLLKMLLLLLLLLLLMLVLGLTVDRMQGQRIVIIDNLLLILCVIFLLQRAGQTE
uniref:Uncharacterized protein n=1 Tax=Anopheles braziliensis TaxID=58242 RepID=A0A2M3ZLM2_9DIPT